MPRELEMKYRMVVKERCRRSAHYFIFDSKVLRTKDEHDAQNSMKNLPDSPYLRCILDLLLVSGKIIRPEQAFYLIRHGYYQTPGLLNDLFESGVCMADKSRQIMATWIICSYILWRAKFRDHQLLLVQSKKEEDAASLVCMGQKDMDLSRISFMEVGLPDWLQNHRNGTYAHITFESGSHIWAIPEGGNIVRSNTPSVLFSDEAAFQPEFGSAYAAAMPAIEGGGQFVAVSSPELGEFQELLAVDEEPIDEELGMIEAFSMRRTPGGLPVFRVGYQSDPDKRPGTPKGDVWLKRVTSKYPKGLMDPRFRKEYCFDYGAMGGTRLFPLWDEWKRHIVIRPFVPVEYKLYGAYDHGWRNPASYTVYGIDGDGIIVALWEFYASNVGVPNIAKIILGETVVLPDGRTFDGNPYAGKESWRIADPQLWAEDQPMSDGTNKSVATLFRRYNVMFTKGERGGDTMVAEWLHGHFWADLEHPLLKITTNCPKLIWEMGQQRFRQISAKTAINADQPEALIDKDNHAWDALKMLLKKFPPRMREAKLPRQPNTFNWWRKRSNPGRASMARNTFRIG